MSNVGSFTAESTNALDAVRNLRALLGSAGGEGVRDRLSFHRRRLKSIETELERMAALRDLFADGQGEVTPDEVARNAAKVRELTVTAVAAVEKIAALVDGDGSPLTEYQITHLGSRCICIIDGLTHIDDMYQSSARKS